MTFVTTSRKALPEVRALAKDLAFALGFDYKTRGKSGLHELTSHTTPFLLISTGYRGTRVQCFSGEAVVADYLVISQSTEERTDTIRKGLIVSDQFVYDTIKPYIPVVLGREERAMVTFDGTRRRRYLLRLTPYGA